MTRAVFLHWAMTGVEASVEPRHRRHTTTTSDGVTKCFMRKVWFDPIKTVVPDQVRGFIQELLDQELTLALGGETRSG